MEKKMKKKKEIKNYVIFSNSKNGSSASEFEFTE